MPFLRESRTGCTSIRVGCQPTLVSSTVDFGTYYESGCCSTDLDMKNSAYSPTKATQSSLFSGTRVTKIIPLESNVCHKFMRYKFFRGVRSTPFEKCPAKKVMVIRNQSLSTESCSETISRRPKFSGPVDTTVRGTAVSTLPATRALTVHIPHETGLFECFSGMPHSKKYKR